MKVHPDSGQARAIERRDAARAVMKQRASIKKRIAEIREDGSVEVWCRRQDPRMEPSDVLRLICDLAVEYIDGLPVALDVPATLRALAEPTKA